VLAAEGVDAGQRLIMRHVGSDTDALLGTVGAAAKLTVLEPDKGVVRFAPWRPFSASVPPPSAFPADPLGRVPGDRQTAPSAAPAPDAARTDSEAVSPEGINLEEASARAKGVGP
jgi:hypothetical protein